MKNYILKWKNPTPVSKAVRSGTEHFIFLLHSYFTFMNMFGYSVIILFGMMCWCLLWCFVLNCMYMQPTSCAVTAILQWKYHDGKHSKLNCHKVMNSNIMWSCDHWVVYKWHQSKTRLSFYCTFFNLLDSTMRLSCRDWHFKMWSHSSNQAVGT